MTPSRTKKCFLIVLLLSFVIPRPTLAQTLDLLWSTFLGGSGDDYSYGVAVDDSGHVYLAGQSQSTDFPAAGKKDRSADGQGEDFFIAKLTPDGDVIRYITFLGGSSSESAISVDADALGNAYATGWTQSEDFPITLGAFDLTLDGDTDAFLVKLNSAGSILEYATYLGGSDEEEGAAIVVDETGRPAVTGVTTSADFPVTPNAFSSNHNGSGDVFVTKFTDWGGAMEFSTLIGGGGDESGHDIAVDRGGNVYLTGRTDSPDYPTTVVSYDTSYHGGLFGDAFVTKVHLTGSVLSYSTFLGGTASDLGQAIALEWDNSAVVMGFTASPDFPTTPGALDTSHNGGGYDLFLSRLDPGGHDLTYSTFLGGSGEEYGYGLALDPDDNAFLTGFTRSSDFPVTLDAFAPALSGSFDIFVAKVNISDSDLLYATYLGAAQDDYVYGPCLATDDSGSAYLAGYTLSEDFPITPGALDSAHHGGFDIFLAKIGPPASTPVDQRASPAAQPHWCQLAQNSPNPFNAATEIRYQLPQEAEVSLRIYNVSGQTVRTLVNDYQPAGFHTAAWDGTDDGHRVVASGIYFCRLQAGDTAETIKMALVR